MEVLRRIKAHSARTKVISNKMDVLLLRSDEYLLIEGLEDYLGQLLGCKRCRTTRLQSVTGYMSSRFPHELQLTRFLT